MIIDPRGLDAITWANQTIPSLARLGVLAPSLQDEEQWRQWGLVVMQDPRVARFNPPIPQGFDDWREWAVRFNQAVPL